jgi:ubiquinone/menaquinone biosynthesis C-methylase UbiE
MSQAAEITDIRFDEARAEAFAERFLDTLNAGAICLMASVGHRTGLFDALGGLPPSTSEEIAAHAGLNERYVREWLGAMTVSRIVEHDPALGTYWLPAEHAAFLTRAATPDNMAVFAQYVAVLGSVEDDVVECFEKGGGVPYEKYTRFHAVMAEDSGQTVLSSLIDRILPLAPGLTERLEDGIRVLDLGCGAGRALNLLAERFPASTFVGYDLSEEAVALARAEAEAKRLGNVEFEVRDLSTFDRDAEPESFDLITTFDAVHDQAQPLALLKGIARALAADGVYLMQDIHSSSHVHNNMDHPAAPLLYTVSCLHCMSVSLAQGGAGLGAMWGREKASELLTEAGLTQVEIQQLPHDFQNDYYIVSKS